MSSNSHHNGSVGIPSLDGIYFCSRNVDGFKKTQISLPSRHTLYRLSQQSLRAGRLVPASIRSIAPGIYVDSHLSDEEVQSTVARHAGRIARYLWPSSVFSGQSAFRFWYPSVSDEILSSDQEFLGHNCFTLILASDPNARASSQTRNIGGVDFILSRGSSWMWEHVESLPMTDNLGTFSHRMLSPAALCLAHTSPWRSSAASGKAHRLTKAAFVFAAAFSNHPEASPIEVITHAARNCPAVCGSTIAELNSISHSHHGSLDSGLLDIDDKVELCFFDTPLGTLYQSGSIISLTLSPGFPAGILPRRSAYADSLPPIIRDMIVNPNAAALAEMVFTGGLRKTSDSRTQRHAARYLPRHTDNSPLSVVINDEFGIDTRLPATVNQNGELVPDSLGEFYAAISPLSQERGRSAFKTWSLHAGHSIASDIMRINQRSQAAVLNVSGEPALVTIIDRPDVPAASGTPAFELPASISSWLETLDDSGMRPHLSVLAQALESDPTGDISEFLLRHYIYCDIVGCEQNLGDICVTLYPDPVLPTQFRARMAGLYRPGSHIGQLDSRDVRDKAQDLESLLSVLNLSQDRLSRIAFNLKLWIEENLRSRLEDLSDLAESASIRRDSFQFRDRLLRNAETSLYVLGGLIELLDEPEAGPTLS